jgi:hypothetical protein
LNIGNPLFDLIAPHYNPKPLIIMAQALFLIDKSLFIRDFSDMRHLLAPLALLAFASVCSAVDEGRDLIRDIITDEGLSSAVILNARNPESRAQIKASFLAKAPHPSAPSQIPR